ncbi:MAG: hypothetical protein DRG78_04480 [Epsilonproteobacteria bacterium]|nr:MAG: hypothetical protein DRG78_04480 [Campylobacterota bacterium]
MSTFVDNNTVVPDEEITDAEIISEEIISTELEPIADLTNTAPNIPENDDQKAQLQTMIKRMKAREAFKLKKAKLKLAPKLKKRRAKDKVAKATKKKNRK